MKWRSPSPGNPKIEIVRPILDLPKAELYAYAKGRRLGFREDASNRSPDFLRNRIRKELLPLLLKNYQPSLAATVSRVMEIVGTENDFIRTEAVEWLRSMKPPFEQLHPALQRRCLHEQLLGLVVSPTFDLIEKLRLKPECRVTLPSDRKTTESAHADSGGSVTRTRSGLIRIEKTDLEVRPDEVQMVELTRSDGGQTVFAGTGLSWEVKPNRSAPFPEWQKGREWFDADLIGSPVFLRHWRPGDRFQPIGMSSATKLQDLFVNQKVPREMRHRLIVATTGDGAIFWVQNQRISERFKLTRRTKRRLQWSWQPD
jgi:tRNA(Ile)-lysidine synthase